MTYRSTTIALVSSALVAAAFVWCLLPPSCRHRLTRDGTAPYGRALSHMEAMASTTNAPSDAFAAQLLLESYRQENQELRRSLNFVERNPSLIAAEVVSYGGSDAWSQRIRIGKGLRDGLHLNAPVLVPEGLVGHVVDITDSTADVLLLSDANSHVACQVPDTSGTYVHGILTGSGPRFPGRPHAGGSDFSLRLDFLDRHAAIAPEGVATTSGLGGIYPSGLSIGVVHDVAFDTSGLYQRALLSPLPPLGALRIVFVLTGWEAAP